MADHEKSLTGFFAMTCDCIARDGWVSKRTAEQTGQSPTVLAVVRRFMARDFNVSDEAAARAEAVYKWAREQRSADDAYLSKIGALARAEIPFAESILAFAASIPEACTRAEAHTPRKQTGASRHVGRVDERREHRVTVERVVTLEGGGYGPSFLHIMRDDRGNRLVWRCTAPAKRLVAGQSYRVRATVKKHDEYRGEQQTVLTRVAS